MHADAYWIVRRAAHTDATQIAECLSELGYGTSAELVAERLQEWAGSPNDAVFVAVDRGSNQVVGVASLHVIPLFHRRGGLARLSALAVRSTAHRRGAGRALIAAVEAFSRLAGCQRIEVTSGDQRLEAHRFYRSLGYEASSYRFIKHLSEESAKR